MFGHLNGVAARIKNEKNLHYAADYLISASRIVGRIVLLYRLPQ